MPAPKKGAASPKKLVAPPWMRFPFRHKPTAVSKPRLPGYVYRPSDEVPR